MAPVGVEPASGACNASRDQQEAASTPAEPRRLSARWESEGLTEAVRPWAAEPTTNGIEAKMLEMDAKWEAIRTEWLATYPDHPLPLVRPTLDSHPPPPFPSRPAPSSSPSSRDINTLLNRRGIPMPRRDGTPRARTPPISYAIGTPHLPSSPLGKISDDQASYFSGVAESLDGTSPSEGMVIQSPDGRPAIFFQPQRTSRSSSIKDKASASSRPMERDRELPESGVEATSGDLSSHPFSSIAAHRTSVAAPHEIGLGQSRRVSSTSSSNSGDSPLNPIGTPALTLDSFIAKSRGQSEENSSTEDPPTQNFNKPAGLSRQQSSASNPSRPSSTRPGGAGSPRLSGIRRTSSPPVSPRLDNSPTAQPATSSVQPRPTRDIPTTAPPSHPPHSRRASGSTSAHSRRSKARKNTIPAVPPIKVLIVEDNVINQKILARFMDKKGIKYEVAKDGEEAVQKWREGSFHLVLMDIQLPVKDGIEATREIREIERASNIGTLISTPTGSENCTPFSSTINSPASPLLTMPVIIVALTASSLQVDRVSALAAGCNDFLTKPVSLPWLQQKLLEWGSMAYLSGFSRSAAAEKPTTTPSSTTPGSSPAFSAVLNSRVADNISAHLHIDRKPGSRSTSPSRPVLPSEHSSSEIVPGGPTLTISSPTPILTPRPVGAISESVATIEAEADEQTFTVSDLKAVDTRLEELRRRPGPSPLSSSAGNPSLESVVAEGARLVAVGRSRANSSTTDSFSLVMHGSGTVSASGCSSTGDSTPK